MRNPYFLKFFANVSSSYLFKRKKNHVAIKIDGIEYVLDKSGMNIVDFDTTSLKVIDLGIIFNEKKDIILANVVWFCFYISYITIC